jgi:DNA repair ATPase RecN
MTPSFADSTAAHTQRLVKERSAGLATYTSSIDEILSQAARLEACVKKLENSNSDVFNMLTAQQQGQCSLEKMSEMLRNLTSVMTTKEPTELHEVLGPIQKNNAVLREIVHKMRVLNTRCQKALQRLESATSIDQKTIEDLTGLREKALQAGLPPTCRDGSTLL